MLQYSVAKWKLTARKQANQQREETDKYIYEVINIQKIDIAAFVVSGLLFLIFNL